MSEGYAAPPPPEPARRARPTTVTIAGLLMLLVALAAVVYLAASIAVLGAMTDAFNEALADSADFQDAGSLFAATTLIAGIAYLLFGIALAILTIFNNQGRNGARITTWVVGGIGLCCGGLSLLSLAFSDLTSGGIGGGADMPEPEEMERILNEHLPSWYEPLTTAGNVVGVLALAVALILLALPASNEFFRKPEQLFEPPAPGYPPVG
jgi:hypothetical protein